MALRDKACGNGNSDAHRRRHAVSGDGRACGALRRDGTRAGAGALVARDVESARFRADNYRTVDDRPVRRRARDGDAGRAAGEGASERRATSGSVRAYGDADGDLPVAAGRAADASARCGAARRSHGYVLLAGRYEGVDERLLEREVDEEIAIGDFVVSGGELPALMLIDAIVRQLPGVLNDARVGGAGFVRRRAARLPALHAAGAGRRASACPTCCCRATTRRSALAAEAVAGQDVGAAAGPAARTGSLTPEEEALLAEYRASGRQRAEIAAARTRWTIIAATSVAQRECRRTRNARIRGRPALRARPTATDFRMENAR